MDTSQQYFEVVTPGHGHDPGQLLKILNGAIPNALKAITRPVDGDTIDPRRARTVDAKAFVEHSTHRRKAPPVQVWLDTAAMLKRFNWTPAQLEAARRCGLPPARQRVKDSPFGQSPQQLWVRLEAAVAEWEQRLKTVANSL